VDASYTMEEEEGKLVRRSIRQRQPVSLNPVTKHVIGNIAMLYAMPDDEEYVRGVKTGAEAHFQAFTMTIRKALRQEDQNKALAARNAAKKECRNIVDKGAVIPVSLLDMTREEKDSIIPAVIIVDEKLKADGSHDRTKVRANAAGNHLLEKLTGNTYAPTVNPATIMLFLSMAAAYNYDIITADVEGAFLVPPMDPEHKYFVEFNKEFSQIMMEMYPRFAPLAQEGKITCRLGRYLYGLPMSSHVFYNHVCSTMKGLGFKAFNGDRCAFIRGLPSDHIYIAVHVDDFLIVGAMRNIKPFLIEL